ncbi:MAG: ComEC/Rec2 family competence protein [Clostridia bacterium]|nr:ComEC/Rec2 family competence protein [Clostridia bacterium]
MQRRVKRPLLVFLLGALCALSLSLFLPGGLLLPGFLLGLLICAVSSAFYDKGFLPALWALLSIGLAFGFLWHAAYDTARVIPAESLDGTTTTLTVRVETLEKFGFVARTTEGEHTFPVYVKLYTDGTIRPGDELSITARFAKPTYRAGFNALHSYASRGIHILATPTDVTTLSHKDTLHTLLHRVRAALQSRIYMLFPGHAGEMSALLIGQADDLPSSIREELVATGLSHAFVVSGMHLSFVAAFLLLFSRISPKLSLFLMPLTLFFAAITGFGHSVVRAFWMLVYRTVGGFLDREPDPSISFFLSLFLILCQNPYALWSMGLVYSYLAVAGILYLGPRLRAALQFPLLLVASESPLRRIMNGLISVFSTSLSAGIATLPASAAFTGCISTLFPITNLLLLWLVTLIFYLGVPALLLSFLWLPAANLLARAAVWLLELFQEANTLLAKIPFALLGIESVGLIAALFLCLFLLFLHASCGRRFLKPLPLALCSLLLFSGIALGQYDKVRNDYIITCPSTKEPCVLVTVGSTHALLGYDEEVLDLLRRKNVTSPDLVILPTPEDSYLLPETFSDTILVTGRRADITLGSLTLRVDPKGNTHIETPDGVISVLFDRGAAHSESRLTMLSRKAFQDEKTRFLLADDTSPLLLMGQPPRIPKWDEPPNYLPYSDGGVVFTSRTLPTHER